MSSMSRTPHASLEAKIVVLGAQGVGKTSLLQRYCKGVFDPSNTTSTVGANFLTKRIHDLDSDTDVRLQLWDTAGQERFRSITRLYYRGAHACILCYSVTDNASFTHLTHWLAELRDHLPPDVILHIVGTKSDIVSRDPSAREVPFERCIAYVAEHLAPPTPPSTNTPSVSPTAASSWAPLNSYSPGALFLGPGTSELEGTHDDESNRNSSFWGGDAGWDACHEVSAETGEGVEEVFRVVARKLIDQNLKMREALLMATTAPGEEGYERGMDGSYFARDFGVSCADDDRPFRVGRDRRSRIFQTPRAGVSVDVNCRDEEMGTSKGTCC